MFSWDDFPNYRVSPAIPSDLRHEDVVRQLELFHALSPDNVKIANLGTSVEGRSISMLTLGEGPKKVLAWSQMHGNEPTHTAVLLDIVNFLLCDSAHSTAKEILAGCTLHLIVMLNPDGAQRWTRRNAQYIDINRDALHLQSPEGQILQKVVATIQPEFALNLHNHRPHTTVGQSQQPASFSLLAPPIDAEETEVDHVRLAKQLAGYLANTVAPHCPGAVSRYDADFMPRCFGEWVQQQGVVTLTIEAGGWSTIDAEPLVHLHFYGLVACLEAIACGSFHKTDPNVYEALPRTGQHDLFDKLLRDVAIFNGLGQEPFRADLGINFSQSVPSPSGGRIVDLGDLHVTSGKILTAVDNIVCIPGRIVWHENLRPARLLDDETTTQLLSAGVTTVLGQVDLSNDEQVAALHSLSNDFSAPLNVGFLAKLTTSTPELLDRLVKAISQGILGVVADELPAEVKLYLSLFSFPIIPIGSLPTVEVATTSLADCASQTQQCAQQLGLKDRGVIRLGSMADLFLVRSGADINANTNFLDGDLQQVIVGGNVVFDEGRVTSAIGGALLTNRIRRE